MRVSALHEFLITPAEAFGVPVCRLGLASYWRNAITADDVLSAVERGVNFLNWQGLAEVEAGGFYLRRVRQHKEVVAA